MDEYNEYKIIHLNSDQYDQRRTDTLNTYYTFFLKNPIILDDIYNLSVNNFTFKNKLNGNGITYDSNSTELGRVVDAQNLELQLIVPIQSTFIAQNVVVLRNDAIKTPTNARLKLSITPNVANGSDCTIRLLEVTATDTGFTENDLILIDKSQFTSEFSYTNQYAIFLVKSIKNKDIIIRNNTNYGFGASQIGTWIYNDEGTLIVIQVYKPAGQTIQARINSISSSRLDYNIDDVITIPNADIRNLATGIYGWNKLYGNLLIDVVNTTTITTDSKLINIKIDDLKIKNTYFNSDRLADSTIVNMCLVNKGINNSFNEITLEPQVINYLKINYSDNFTIGSQFVLTLLLKKNISY